MEIWPFEKGEILFAEADIVHGWRVFKKGKGNPGFCEQAYLDVSGNCKVRIQAMLDARQSKLPRGIPMSAFMEDGPSKDEISIPAKENEDLKIDFPTKIEASGSGRTLAFRIASGMLRLAVSAPLASSETLPNARKPGVYEHLPNIARYGGFRLTLQVWVSFTTAPFRKNLTTREWDLLPFLSGGQFESNRRRH